MNPMNNLQLLTKREVEVISGYAIMGAKAVSTNLNISTRTVEKHIDRAKKKLGIHTTTELVHLALAAGFIENIYAEL